MSNKNHYVIIMAGGIGTRFWPMSRSQYPKQFHDILNRGNTLIQETFQRFASFIPTSNIYVVTNKRYAGLVKEQLPVLSEDQILLEPVGRNTAPCIAYASFKIRHQNPNAVFVVAPSDHLIQKEDVFRKNISLGLEACQNQEMIMTLGIKPSRPDTGYGYIQFLEDAANRGYFKVKTFTEKPKLEVAKSFLESGDFVWNGGIFLFSAKTISSAFETHLPEMADAFTGITEAYYTSAEQDEIDKVFGTCKNISIDYGIMEQAENVFVIPSDFGWSDLGTWGSVHENMEKDAEGNAIRGLTQVYDAKDNMIHVSNGEKLVAIKGLEDCIVVDTENALLICKKTDEQFIKQIVGDIKAKYNEEYA